MANNYDEALSSIVNDNDIKIEITINVSGIYKKNHA
jgi:hypothetical protein